MRNGRRLRKHTSQCSVHYYVAAEDVSARRCPDYMGEMYPRMLIEDVSLSIMPIGGRAEKRAFRVFVSPEDKETAELIAAAVGNRGYREELAGAVCDFVRDCAQVIMACGEAYYEIVYWSDEQAAVPSAFELLLIQPGSVVRHFQKLVQYIPPAVAKERGLPVYLGLPHDRVILFEGRSAFRNSLKSAMDKLSVMSRGVLPPFVLEMKTGEAYTIPFDVEAHDRVRRIALASATRVIGWNARGLLQGEAAEWYWLRRHLRFEKFKVELRDRILGTLNEAIRLASRRIGFFAQIAVEGLPTLQDVEAAEAALEAGSAPFKEIFEKFVGF